MTRDECVIDKGRAPPARKIPVTLTNPGEVVFLPDVMADWENPNEPSPQRLLVMPWATISRDGSARARAGLAACSQALKDLDQLCKGESA